LGFSYSKGESAPRCNLPSPDASRMDNELPISLKSWKTIIQSELQEAAHRTPAKNAGIASR